MTTMDRLLQNSVPEPNSGCWLWLMSVDHHGYGKMGVGPKVKMAHRVSYELKHGAIPEGNEIDHLCRVRCCVNPDHLEAVTHQVNVQRGETGEKVRGIQRAKTHCPYGHEYTPLNTKPRKSGTRSCRACDKLWGRRPRQRRRGGL